MDLETEYNNRARVADHEQIISAWWRDAANFRAAAVGELNLSYGGHVRQATDIFWPDQDRHGPMVVFIHGGYWQALDKDFFSHMTRGVSVYGIPVAVPSYRLCPDVAVADIIADMRRLCIWLWKRHKRRIVVAGHSAGAHLAATMAATDWSGEDVPGDVIAAGFGISGIYDLRPLIATSQNANLKLGPETALRASPLMGPAPKDIPFEAWVGALESSEFIRQSATLSACWRGCGAPVRMFTQADANHFTVINPLGQPNSTLTRALAALCRKT